MKKNIYYYIMNYKKKNITKKKITRKKKYKSKKKRIVGGANCKQKDENCSGTFQNYKCCDRNINGSSKLFKGDYFPGTIMKVNGDGTYGIKYDDEDWEKNALKKNIRYSPKTPLAVGQKIEAIFKGKPKYLEIIYEDEKPYLMKKIGVNEKNTTTTGDWIIDSSPSRVFSTITLKKNPSPGEKQKKEIKLWSLYKPLNLKDYELIANSSNGNFIEKQGCYRAGWTTANMGGLKKYYKCYNKKDKPETAY